LIDDLVWNLIKYGCKSAGTNVVLGKKILYVFLLQETKELNSMKDARGFFLWKRSPTGRRSGLGG
jgi:hypothetical protein